MTTLYSSTSFQDHDTGSHPETAKRLASIDAALAVSSTASSCKQGTIKTPDELDLSWIRGIHSVPQIEQARAVAQQGGGYLDPDTVLSPKSYDVALKACATACSAIDTVIKYPGENALCLIRPPGHHATANRSMGFCIFNNVAVAAHYALKHHSVNRVLIVDWDVHHGNGTQDIFYDSEQVMFYSIHRFPFYPGSGNDDETGSGKGLGFTINSPISYGTQRTSFLSAFAHGLAKAADKIKPELVLISAGFDAHKDDPVGSLGLESSDYLTMTDMVCDVARTHAHGRVASFLEGGYNLGALAESVEFHLQGLLNSERTST